MHTHCVCLYGSIRYLLIQFLIYGFESWLILLLDLMLKLVWRMVVELQNDRFINFVMVNSLLIVLNLDWVFFFLHQRHHLLLDLMLEIRLESKGWIEESNGTEMVMRTYEDDQPATSHSLTSSQRRPFNYHGDLVQLSIRTSSAHTCTQYMYPKCACLYF